MPIIIIGALIVAGLGVGVYFYSHKNTVPLPITNLTPTNSIPATSPSLVPVRQTATTTPRETVTNVSGGKEKIAYLASGTVWVLNRDLNQRYKLIETADTIASFHISPLGNEVYWATDKGELWKKNANDKLQPLITISDDMTKVEDTRGGEYNASGTLTGEEKFTYLKGQVEDFYLSPSGKYIVYRAIERYTACCAGNNEFPTYSLWSMRSDGTQKTKMVDPNSSFAEFKGWLPNDAGIMYLFHDTDEPTGGQGFYKLSFDGKNNYRDINYIVPLAEGPGRVSQFLGTAPVFSPDGKKVAYFNYNDGISLSNIDGSEKQKLVAVDRGNVSGNPFLLDIGWSGDSQSLAVRVNTSITLFSKSGKQIFETNLPKEPKEFTIFSQDNKYAVETYEKDGKLFISLVGLTANDTHEFDISDTEISRDIQKNFFPTVTPEFISKNGEIYFISTREGVGGEPNPSRGLWNLNIVTGEKHRISDGVSSVQAF